MDHSISSLNNKTRGLILYVDDDLDDLEFFENAMRRLDRQVELFNSSTDFLQSLNSLQQLPDLVFLDLNMPTKNGFEVLQQIRSQERFKNLPLIIYSTAGDSATVDRCRKNGATLYIRKPTSIAALQQVLRQVFAIDWSTFKPDVKNFVV